MFLWALLGIRSNSNTVGNAVWGKVVVRELFALVALGDGADDLIQILAEFCHSLFHWLLHEVFIRVHAQKQLIEKYQEIMLWDLKNKQNKQAKYCSVLMFTHPVEQTPWASGTLLLHTTNIKVAYRSTDSERCCRVFPPTLVAASHPCMCLSAVLVQVPIWNHLHLQKDDPLKN